MENDTRISGKKKGVLILCQDFTLKDSALHIFGTARSRDKQRQESKKFQGDSVMSGSCKQCNFSFSNGFMLTHNT